MYTFICHFAYLFEQFDVFVQRHGVVLHRADDVTHAFTRVDSRLKAIIQSTPESKATR